MSISWDCAFARGEPGEGKSLASAQTLVSLGLDRSPVLAAAVEAGDDGFASQIAVKMSAEAIVEAGFTAAGESHDASSIVAASFKSANDKVYEYSHRMAAGGSFAAKAVLAAIDRSRICVGQLGGCTAFLLRDGTLLDFFQNNSIQADAPRDTLLARFIGANVKIAVDLASMDAQAGDRIAVCTRVLGKEKREALGSLLAQSDSARTAADSILQNCLASSSLVGESFVRPMMFVLFVNGEDGQF